MNEREGNKWGSAFVEGAVIVISILLAFWIDAWWVNSQDREREVVMLRALLGDLQRMSDQVEDYRNYNQGILESTTTLLEFANAPDRTPTAQEVDALLADICWYNPAVAWESAAMDLLTNSGGMSNLSDVVLVEKLASLHLRLRNAGNRFRLDEDFYRNRLIPFLGDNANLPQILSTIEEAPGGVGWTYDFPVDTFAKARNHTSLLYEEDFQGLLAARVDLQIDILEYSLADMDESIQEVVEMLQLNLEE